MDEQVTQNQTDSNEPPVNKVVTTGEVEQAQPAELQKPEETIMKKLPTEEKGSKFKVVLIVIVVIIAGVGTGYALSTLKSSKSATKSAENLSEEGIKAGDVFGSADEKTFRDQVDGVLVKGGIDGEGSHHLLRPGDASQNVYLTSSVLDLDLFLDYRVKIWGETFSAQKAGWLMDVGRVEVIELNAEKPFEE